MLKKIQLNRYIDVGILVFLCVFPLMVPEFRVEQMCRYICFTIFAISLDLLWGYTGLLSLGHAVLFGIGGYLIGIFYNIQSGVPAFMTREGITSLPWFFVPLKNPAIAILAALALPTFFAFVLGSFIFSSKVKGVFFTIITLALAQIFNDFIVTSQKYTNGFNGLQGIRRFAFGQGDPLSKTAYYYLVLAIAVIVFIACLCFTHSRLGKVATAIRDNETRLSYFGYSTSRYKILIFSISGFFAGLAGLLYAPATGTITTEDIGIAVSTMCVIWVAVGGRGNLTGAVLGTLLINWAESKLSEYFSDYWQLILGGILLCVIFFIPRGIIGELLVQYRKYRKARSDVLILKRKQSKEGAVRV